MPLPFRTIVLNIASCTECPKHQLIEDPHAAERAREDDVAVVCTLCPNPLRDAAAPAASAQSPHRVIVAGCRPDEIDARAGVPDWCPLWHKDLFLGA